MDKFGIYNLLSSLSKFYMENNNNKKEETEVKQDNTSDIGNIFKNKDDMKKEEKNIKKTETNDKNSYTDLPKEYFNQKMFEKMNQHDEFVKRVTEKNKTKI